MSTTIEAMFDGTVLRPITPLTFRPNTRVWIIVDTVPPIVKKARSFLRTARSLHLDGPPDWSSDLENYLYGDKTREE